MNVILFASFLVIGVAFPTEIDPDEFKDNQVLFVDDIDKYRLLHPENVLFEMHRDDSMVKANPNQISYTIGSRKNGYN